jgi:hypothetical protein
MAGCQVVTLIMLVRPQPPEPCTRTREARGHSAKVLSREFDSRRVLHVAFVQRLVCDLAKVVTGVRISYATPRGCRSMAGPDTSNVKMGVRFSLPTLEKATRMFW